MPSDTLRQISGTFADPSGTVYANQTLTWFRARRVVTGQGSTSVVDQPFYNQTDAAGVLNDEVMPGNYTVLASLSDGDRYFNVSVPDEAGPFNIADLLDAGPVDDSIVTQVQALVIEARTEAENAEAAADRAAANAVAVVSRAWFPTVTSLTGDNNSIIGYSGAGAQFTVADGDLIEAGGFRYQVAAEDAEDHHRTTAGGVKLRVVPGADGALPAAAFGISVNNTKAQNDPLIEKLLTAQKALGGGSVALGSGTFAGVWDMNPPNQDGLSIVGNEQATTLNAGADGAWAMIYRKTSGTISRSIPTVRDLTFTGSNRKRNGLFVTRQQSIQADNLTFDDMLVGELWLGNYYFGGSGRYYNQCDVGLATGFASGTTLTDLIDGDGAATTVTLPEGGWTGHHGNKIWRNFQFKECRIGAALTGPSHVLDKWTLEKNNIGILMRDGNFRLNECWLESNGAAATDGAAIPAATHDFAGETYPCAAIVMRNLNASGSGVGNATFAHINGGRFDGLDVGTDCHAHLDGSVLVNGPVSIGTGGSVVGDRVVADHRALPFLCKRPTPSLVQEGRYITTYCPPKTNRVYGVKPNGGEILIADDCTGAALTSSRWNITYTNTALVYEVAGGLFAEQKHITGEFKASADSPWSRISLQPPTTEIVADSDFYVLYLAVKMPVDGLEINPSRGATSTQLYYSSGTRVSLSPPAGEWVTLCYSGPSRNAAVNPDMAIENLSSAGVLAFGGIQFARFANRHDAAEFIASPNFYMTES
ncbi:hypothetical protein ACGYJ8_14565 [Sulfitobacter sp. 1A12126]|uniref:hypothetical protein n=1 Tax=Sulfitobacter sp. 1A12126 TaxID=3368591 RepID=UPI0037468AB7